MKKDDYLKHKMACLFSVPLQWFLDQQRREREREEMQSPFSLYEICCKETLYTPPWVFWHFFFTKETVAVFSVPFYSLLPSKGK